jgi:hypothetical protein
MRRTTSRLFTCTMALLVVAAVARAQEKVGSAAALEGKAEVLHQGTTGWAPLAAGDPVFVGDQVRTLADSKLKLVFREDSVLSLAASSTLTVTEQTVAPVPSSSFSLLLGTLKAIVTERYSEPRARFEVETPTAIAGVRGTGFIASYDASQDETLVVGLYDTTHVRASTDAKGAHTVDLGPGRVTRVRRGKMPLAPTKLPEDQLRGLEGATNLAAAGTSPTREFGATHGSQGNTLDAKRPEHSGSQAITTEGQVVDQQQFKHGGKPPGPLPH